jgi:hypothetical protein
MRDDPVARGEGSDARADLDDFPGDLMAEDRVGLLPDVPVEKVGTADPDHARSEKRLSLADPRDRNVHDRDGPIPADANGLHGNTA